jgi:rhodanese-related sulfurtransferase
MMATLSLLVPVVLCLALIFFMTVGAGTEEEDAAKATQVEDMYDRYKKSFPQVKDIAAQDAMRLYDAGKVLFVDVRDPEEQAVSMLPAAITGEAFLKDPRRYKDKLVIGYCTISYRSGVLAKKLHEKGITMVNLRGGLLAWLHEGGKVYQDGQPVNKVHVYGRKWNLSPDAYEAVW